MSARQRQQLQRQRQQLQQQLQQQQLQQSNPYVTNPFGQRGPLTEEYYDKLSYAIAKEYPEPVNQMDPYRLKSSAWIQGLGKMPDPNDVTINDSDFKGGRRMRRSNARKSTKMRRTIRYF